MKKCLFFCSFVTGLKRFGLIVAFLFMGYSAFADSTPVPESAVIPSFNISPNPVSGNTFAVQLNFTQGQFPDARLIISNVLGQAVYQYSMKKVDYENGYVIIDVSETKLEKGVYFVQVKSGEASKTVKLAIR